MNTLVTILFSLLCTSLYAQEKTAQKLTSNKEIMPKIRMAVKYQKENKIFRDLVAAMQQKGYYPIKLNDWSNAYKNNIGKKISTRDSIFIQIPKNLSWQGKSDAIKSVSETIYFKEASVNEVVLKQKIVSSMKADIKIIQFIFESTEKAKAALPKMKKVAAYTISVRGLKSPNLHWVHENTIYFCRVRAAAFSAQPFLKIFEKKHGKVKVLRW